MFHFHSNQKIEISGDLEYSEQIEAAFDFAMYYSDTSLPDICYQIGEDGVFCIGWIPYDGIEPGWHEFPDGFTKETVIRMITEHICNYLSNPDIWQKKVFLMEQSGSCHEGFLMECMDACSFKNIESPTYGIVSFSPFVAFYHK